MFVIRKARCVLVVLFVGSALLSCSLLPSDESTSLYSRLGGKPGVAAIVNQMLVYIASDDRINYTFAQANIPRLRGLLEEQFCEVSGGPCEYSGFSMKESHRGMNITQTEFTALVESLQAAMEDQHVAIPDQNALLAKLAPMYRDVTYN